MEEIRTYEELENTEVVEVNEEPETSSKGVGGLVIGGLALVVGATAIVLHKTKAKRKAKRIEKLRKEGYVIISPEEVDELETVSEDDCEVIEEK